MTKRHSSLLGILVESFLTRRLIQQQQASPATVSAYKDALRLLFRFASSRLGRPVDQLDIRDLDYELVLAFLDFPEKERGNRVRTRNARLAVVHSFFQHVAYAEPDLLALSQRILSIGTKRTTKRVVAFLQPPEVEALLATPNRRTQQGRRDYALLLFLLHTGVRASEALGVNTVDLTLRAPSQVLVHGKGSKQRVLPLANDLAMVLRNLMEERQLDPHGHMPVFVNAQGNRLTRFGLTHIVRRAVTKASTECATLRRHSVSPHSFRHTAAMRLLQAGVDLASIRSWLGHASIQTTHDYLEADVEMKRRALEAANVTSANATKLYKPPDAIMALLER